MGCGHDLRSCLGRVPVLGRGHRCISRKVVGWSFGETMTANLVISALNMALITRKPGKVIHHSDQGSQYTRVEFGKRCREMGVRPSMGSVGDAYDNAMAESFFASLECELIDRRSWKNKTGHIHLNRVMVQPNSQAF